MRDAQIWQWQTAQGWPEIVMYASSFPGKNRGSFRVAVNMLHLMPATLGLLHCWRDINVAWSKRASEFLTVLFTDKSHPWCVLPEKDSMSTYELILCSKMKMKDPKTTFLQKF